MVKPLVSGEDFPTNRMKLGSFFQMKLVGYAVVRSCTQLLLKNQLRTWFFFANEAGCTESWEGFKQFLFKIHITYRYQ